MIPTLALREQAMKLLAADNTTLAPAVDGNVIALIKNNVSPTEQTVLADLDFADFDGSDPVEAGTGTQPEGLDPLTTDAIVDIKTPLGGFRWETTGVTNLPQTIYAFALLKNDLSVLYAVEALATPVELTAINQRIDIGQPNLRQAANSIS